MLKTNEQEEKQCSLKTEIENGVINFTNQLLKNFKITNMLYLLIKFFEHLQIMYFLMRAVHDYHWDFSFLVFFNIFLNHISWDQLFKLYPSIFLPTFYSVMVMLFIIVAMMVIITKYAGWGKQIPNWVKPLVSIVGIFFFMFKTILFIPLLNIICIANGPSIAKELGISGVNAFVEALGALLAVMVLVFMINVLVFFRKENPFSDFPSTGETITKGFFWQLSKLIMVVYVLLDVQGKFQRQSTVVFTIILFLVIVYSHYEVGLYRSYFKKIQLRLLYSSFALGVVHSTYYLKGDVTTLLFLVPLNLLVKELCDWIILWKHRKIQTTRFLTIQDVKVLEEHIIYLIMLIEGISVRKNRADLLGYIHYHKKQCKKEICPCNQLCLVKAENIDKIKFEAYKLVVHLLNEAKRKFPKEKKIQLLLGLLYHYRIKNEMQAIYSITKMQKNRNASILDRLQKIYYLQRIEKEMKEVDEREVNKTTQINKYFEFTNKLVQFQDNIESCTRYHINFWRLVQDVNPDIRQLEELGTKITRTRDQLKTQFDQISSINGNCIHLLTVYGKFLLQVTNQEAYNVKFIEKADVILKNVKQSTKIDDLADKYDENSNTAVVIISGNDGKTGMVEHTNNLVKDLLGYQRSELLDRNVSTIMPKIYGEYHDEVLKRYLGSSESSVNGHERVVPALTKEGFMLPITALTKVLPSLIDGIQIIALIAKYESVPVEEDQVFHEQHFLLYRTDTEQILGVSEGCSQQYAISPTLIYGNPLNVNDELTVKHIFGISLEKGEEGRIAAALEVGEVYITLNTKNLKNEFAINKGSIRQDLLDCLGSEKSLEGVETQVCMKQVLSSVYNCTPLKLLAISTREQSHSRSQIDKRSSKTLEQYLRVSNPGQNYEKKDSKSLFQQGQQSGDDVKNLKDFKNFISIRRQPRAITIINAVCILFLLILSGSVIGLIVNHQKIVTINKNIIELYKLTLQVQMVLPELLTQVEKEVFAYELANTNTPGFTSINSINQTLNYIIKLSEHWQLEILPFRYFFNENYDIQIPSYHFFLNGNVTTSQIFEEEVINNYITRIHAIITSNVISLLSNSTNILQNNLNEEYSSAQLNILYSIRNSLNSSNILSQEQYKQIINQKKTILIVINVLIMFMTILWAVLLLPYILSITKINNRVLSLFTLVPNHDISKLIYNCLTFLHQNLREAQFSQDELDMYEGQQKAQLMKKSFVVNQSAESPSAFDVLMNENTQGQIVRKGERVHTQNLFAIQQKFEKMKNSEDRNKKAIVLKFVGVSLLILGLAFFYLFFSMSFISSSEKSTNNYYLMGRRPALIRHLKLLLNEYLKNPNYQPSGFDSIQTLNRNIIIQFYALEANLLFLNLGSNQQKYIEYNNGDCCAAVNNYLPYAIFRQVLSTAECSSLNSGVFTKGLKTGVVSVLQDLRSILSIYPTSVPQNIRISKILEYDKLTKYIQTPMLQVLAEIQSSINQSTLISQIIIIAVGALFIIILLICWKFVWQKYISELNVKIWRTKGLLNLIPMRIITENECLKNQFTSGQLQKAVR